MYCPNCGTEFDEVANFCAECGADVRERVGGESATAGARAESEVRPNEVDGRRTTGEDGEGVGPAPGRVQAESTTAVPENAAAIDITCPICGTRPIEELANGHRITGFVVFYTKKTYQLIGCHACLRRKLWWMSAKNLVLGWWGLKAAFWNLVLTVKNVTRGAINRGPNAHLVYSLESVGVTYDFLDDPDAFDPSQHAPMELYIRSFVRLGVAIMFADGQAQPEERRAIGDAITRMVPDYPEEKLERLLDRASRTPVDVERVAEGLRELLDPEGRLLVVSFLASVADAGSTTDEDIEMVAVISRALDLDEEEVDAALDEDPTIGALP